MFPEEKKLIGGLFDSTTSKEIPLLSVAALPVFQAPSNSFDIVSSLLSAIVESSDDAIVSKDLSGTITSWNSSAERIFGYTRQEIVGESVLKLIPEELKVEEAKILSAIKRGERVDHFETVRVRKDGVRIEVSLTVSPIKNREGIVVGASKIARDISSQRVAHDAWRHLASIVDSSDDAIVSKSLQGVITSWNKSAERIFGFTGAEAVGKHISLIIPEDRLEEEPQILARLQRGERVDHFETIRRCKDGRLLDISLTISPVRNAAGKIIGASKVARDITEKKLAERALHSAQLEVTQLNSELEKRVNERTRSLQEAVDQMEEFSYTVSHDLRAPLRAVHSYTQALIEDHAKELSDEARSHLKRIFVNATRLDKMVLDLLSYTRVNRAQLTISGIELDRLVRDIVENYPSMQAPAAELQIDRLDNVQGHEPSVSQAVSNLLTNAVKFIAPGVLPRIHIWTEKRGAHIRLWIEDNGIGIPPLVQNRLFRMFERTHTGNYEGNGVGLAIVRKAVTRMGGEAGLESDGKSGSRFWIELPAASGSK